MIKIGVIANTHALKGEVKIKSFSEFNDVRFAKGNKMYISFQNTMKEVIVKEYREVKEMVYVKFDGYDSINDVEQYKGCEISIDENELHDLEENEFYYFQLMGCVVFDEENNELGIVEDVLETGANAVLRVNKTILIPYVNDFIISTDIKNKKIIIHKMDGLL